MGLRIKILGAVVILVCAAWSGFWWFAASTVESASADAIVKAGERGVSIDCGNKTVQGWPFRMTLVCDSVGVDTKDVQVAARGLRAVAMVYNPSHLIVEADSPVQLASSTLPGPVTANWKSGRASFQLSSDILERASLVFSDLALQSSLFRPLKDPVAEQVEVHFKRSEQPANLDVAIRSQAVESALGSTHLPQFDLDVLAMVSEGAHLLVGQNKRFLERAKAGDVAVALERALISIGEARIQISGDFALAQNGHLNGTPRIAIANTRALGQALAGIPGLDMSRIQPFLQLFSGFGEKTEIDGAPASAVTLTIRDGRVTAGLIPMGRLQPIRLD